MAGPATTSVALKLSAPALRWAWDHQDEIEPKLKNIYRATRRRIFGRSPGILVLGPGGVGKTTLGRVLSGRYDFLLDAGSDYEQSVRVQTFRGKNNPDVELLVAPGQEDRRHATWPDLLGRLAAGREMGVIHCCAYGYHSLSINHRDHRLYDKTRGLSHFLPRFLSDRRHEEIRALANIISSLAQNPKPTWLLTFVAKEDLWSNEDNAVRHFYTLGDYAGEVDKVAKRKGDRHFRHEVVFGSLVIRNFMDGRGAQMATNASGYDQVRQVRSLRHMFETIDALETWKAG